MFSFVWESFTITFNFCIPLRLESVQFLNSCCTVPLALYKMLLCPIRLPTEVMEPEM